MKETEFTILFKIMRANSNLTLRALGEDLGLSASYLNDLEKGNRKPNERVVEALVTFYNLNLNQQRILYDSVANSTDSLSFDVIRFLKENPEELLKIINTMQQNGLKR